MTFTYNLANDIGKVRFLIGDTVATKHVIEDEDITYALTTKSSNLLLAAAFCCDSLSARFAPDPILRTVTYMQDRTDAYAHYKDLAQRLRDDNRITNGLAAGFGFIWRPLTRTSKAIINNNLDIIKARAFREIHKNPGVIPETILDDELDG